MSTRIERKSKKRRIEKDPKNSNELHLVNVSTDCHLLTMYVCLCTSNDRNNKNKVITQSHSLRLVRQVRFINNEQIVLNIRYILCICTAIEHFKENKNKEK